LPLQPRAAVQVARQAEAGPEAHGAVPQAGQTGGMMKLSTLEGALLLLASSAALAQGADPLATRPGLEIGGQIAQYRYEEPSIPVKLDGLRAGFVGAYTFASPEHPFFRIDGRASYGALSYQ